MKKIFLNLFVLIMVSCNFQDDNPTNNSQSEIQQSKNDSIAQLFENLTKKPLNNTIIELPVLGTIDLTKMIVDSSNEYGAGDCWGKVTRYSSSNGGLAIDSMNCGEYGYTHTYYLLSSHDFIHAVFTKKLESYYDQDNETFYFILQELIVDCNSNPPISMLKRDTVTDFYNKKINKSFIIDTLKDRLTTYEHWEIAYKGLWEMEMKI